MDGMRVAIVALIVFFALLIILPTHGQEFSYPGWETTWVNNFKGDRLTQKIEVFPIKQDWNPRPYVEEDGGYTYNILLRYRPGEKIYMYEMNKGLVKVDYTWEHVLFVSKVVRTWQAALQYAAEHYEWGRHLSKIRLKLYIEGINETIPAPDVVIDPTQPPCPVGIACTFPANTNRPYLLITGDIFALSHELGHALGLGHTDIDIYDIYYPKKIDWRGFHIGGLYPAWGYSTAGEPSVGPPDTFVLYALAVRFSSLRNASPGNALRFEGGWLSPPSNLTIISRPGEVWIYHYKIHDEGENWIGIYDPDIPLSLTTDGIYGETLCIKPFNVETGENLPYIFDYGNNTKLVLHGYDVQRVALVAKLGRQQGVYLTHVPAKLFHRLMPFINQTTSIRTVHVYGGVGSGWENFTAVTMNGQNLCFENLRDRLLVELRLGRAYRLDAGPVRVEAVSGWVHHDGNYTWVLRNSVVRLKPDTESYQLSEDARMVWRGEELQLNVTSPMSLVDRLWKPQYLVKVEGLFSELFRGVGWVDKGSTIKLYPEKDVVDLGNGTRLVFKGFEGYNGTEITVERPLTIKPVWERQYRVRLDSRYILAEEKYFTSNETLYTVMPLRQEFGNGTMVELINMTAIGMDGRILDAWRPRAGTAALLKYTLSQPVTVKVEWRVYQMVKLDSPVDSFRQYFENGTTLDLGKLLKQSVELGNSTRLVLKHVTANGERLQTPAVTVTKPLEISPEYARQYIVTFMIEAGEGYYAEPSHVILSREGESATYTPPISYIGEGGWETVSIAFRGEEVGIPQQISITGPGEYRLKTGMRTIKIKAVDMLGMPAPFTEAYIYPDIRAMSSITGTMLLPAVPPHPIPLKASSPLGGGETTIQPNTTEATIVIPLSIWTIVIVATACSVAAVFIRLRRRRPQP